MDLILHEHVHHHDLNGRHHHHGHHNANDPHEDDKIHIHDYVLVNHIDLDGYYRKCLQNHVHQSTTIQYSHCLNLKMYYLPDAQVLNVNDRHGLRSQHNSVQYNYLHHVSNLLHVMQHCFPIQLLILHLPMSRHCLCYSERQRYLHNHFQAFESEF